MMATFPLTSPVPWCWSQRRTRATRYSPRAALCTSNKFITIKCTLIAPLSPLQMTSIYSEHVPTLLPRYPQRAFLPCMGRSDPHHTCRNRSFGVSRECLRFHWRKLVVCGLKRPIPVENSSNLEYHWSTGACIPCLSSSRSTRLSHLLKISSFLPIKGRAWRMNQPGHLRSLTGTD